MCRSKAIKLAENEVDDCSNTVIDISNSEFVMGVIKNSTISNKDWYEKLKINLSKYLIVKLDTGAQCNVIPIKKFKQLQLREGTLKPSNISLTNYNG